jgi:hypothetical protein
MLVKHIGLGYENMFISLFAIMFASFGVGNAAPVDIILNLNLIKKFIFKLIDDVRCRSWMGCCKKYFQIIRCYVN